MKKSKTGWLPGYARSRLLLIIVFALCAAIFALVFYLYRIPVQASGYGALLCLCLLIPFAVRDMVKYHKRRALLENLAGQPENAVQMLPPAQYLLEDSYQELLKTMDNAQSELISRTDQAASEREEYYALWAHQIKTPIAALRLLIPEEGAARNELLKIEQYVEMALAHVRLDSESNDFVLKTCPLDGIVRQAIRKNAGLFIARRLEVEYDGTDASVLTDEKWLLFVVEQILSNALKYTQQGKVRIYLTEPLSLTIEDTGIGIAAEDLPRVFERGYTGYNGRRDKKSTGIGLYLCKRICDQLGHGLEIRSEVGKGTTVILCLDRDELDTAD